MKRFTVKLLVLLVALALCLPLLAGCSGKSGKTLIEIEGVKVSVNTYELLLSRMKGTLAKNQYKVDSDDFWATIVDSSNTTYDQYLRDSILENAKTYAIGVYLFDKVYNLTLPAETLNAIDAELAELIEDEMSEDYARLAGLAAEEELQEPLKRSVAKRLPWLAVLFALGLAVSWVVGLFEAVADAVPVIVSFQSLILGMAGNVGTQSLAVTVRLLADEHLSPAQKAYLVFKEARVGMVNGLVLGTVSLLAVGGYIFLIRGDIAFAISVAICTAAALLISMLLSGIFGASIPLLLKKVGVDPAVASGPFITTVNDLVAVVTYYGMAILLLM